MGFIPQLTGVYLDGSIDLLDSYWELGVRMAHPPFDTRASDIRAWQSRQGLTAFGRQVLRRMERLGMIVDLSHASDRMVQEALELASGPVVVSHGMCRSLCPTGRNLTDEQIRRIAGTGGVVGLHFAGQLIDPEYGERLEASGFREELARWVGDLERRYPDPGEFARVRYDIRRWERSRAYRLYQSVPPPGIDKVVDHLDRMVGLAGIDHVCVGSDYDLGNVPKALDGADKLPALTHAIRRRGYSQADVRKVLGGNFMRVFGQVCGG
jgi:membrane dipeptidase